ncbi:MAG: serine hydrolase [Elusimicrobia bacterium]|nr:serine hydrolase [Elusimicrobiota bacterium]
MKRAPTLLAAAALSLAAAWPVGAAEPSVRAAEPSVRAAEPVERPDPALQSRHLPSGRSAAVRAEETFPTASMIKVPILLAVFDRLERGELEYNQPVVYRSRSEAVLVNAPSGDYVFCVATKDQADTTYADDNEGTRLIRTVSKALWETFEPGHPWTPAEGSRRYQKKD